MRRIRGSFLLALSVLLLAGCCAVPALAAPKGLVSNMAIPLFFIGLLMRGQFLMNSSMLR